MHTLLRVPWSMVPDWLTCRNCFYNNETIAIGMLEMIPQCHNDILEKIMFYVKYVEVVN